MSISVCHSGNTFHHLSDIIVALIPLKCTKWYARFLDQVSSHVIRVTQEFKKKKESSCKSVTAYFCFPPHSFAVHRDGISHLAPALVLEPSASFSVANRTRGTHFAFGSVAGAAVAALRVAQIETQARIALQQLATLVTIAAGNQCHNTATLVPLQLALLGLNRQRLSPAAFNVKTHCKTYINTEACLSGTMYHHRPQQQGSQPFANGPRPTHHQLQNIPTSAIMSQGMEFPYHRPTQLPDELESALAIRSARDMDHRLADKMSRPTHHQNQCSVSGSSQRGSFDSDLVALSSDNQPGHQQGVDWSSYQNATQPFSGSHIGTGHQSQQLHAPPQQSKSSHTGTRIPHWSDTDLPTRHLHSGGGDGQGLYTAESAGSILASFGLSNEDLEVLSHYPDDQLTPDTLPFILRDIQVNKTSNQKMPPTAPAAPPSSFSRINLDLQQPHSHSSALPSSRPPDVSSLFSVTQTAGKVIDYGHASRAKKENNTRETFKREQLSGDRAVKMYATSSPPPQNVPRGDKIERHQLPLARADASKHGDRDYRSGNNDHRKRPSSPRREFSPLSKHRNLDQDYRREAPKPRSSPDTESDTSSRRSLSSSSGTKQPRSSSKKLPTATMIHDFSAVAPKVYPHTCSLCHIKCNEEKVSANMPQCRNLQRVPFPIDPSVKTFSPTSCLR